jgi:RNA polymerase sigma-70 factor (ECF subfamily)
MKQRNNKGIPGSFESVVSNSSRYVYSLSYRLTGSLDEAKDLMQDTYLKAFRKWDTVKNNDNPIPWLRKICVNCFIDNSRKASTKLKMKEVDFPSEEHDIASPALSPEEEVLLGEEIQTIRSQCFTILTSSLNLYQRISFVLIDIFGLDMRDVAQLIDKSHTATKSLLYRARGKMNRFLGLRCGLVSPDNICRCKSWTAVSHDVQKKRDLLKVIIARPETSVMDTIETKKRMTVLFRTLPYLNPPGEVVENIPKIEK